MSTYLNNVIVVVTVIIIILYNTIEIVFWYVFIHTIHTINIYISSDDVSE